MPCEAGNAAALRIKQGTEELPPSRGRQVQGELSMAQGSKLMKPKENTAFSGQQREQDPVWDGAGFGWLDQDSGSRRFFA